MTAFLSLTFIPQQLKAESASVTNTIEAKEAKKAESLVLVKRLDAIKSMDKSNMSSSEKKSLRKEVRSIRSRLNEMDGGVYLSVGAIIIIVLLLIILL